MKYAFSLINWLTFGYAGPVPCLKGPYERFLKLATRGPSLFSGRNGKIAPVGATVPRERWILVCGPNFLKYFGLCFISFAIKPPGDWVHFMVKMGKLLLWALQCLDRAELWFGVCEPNFQKYYGFCFMSFALKPPGGRAHFVVKMGSSLLCTAIFRCTKKSKQVPKTCDIPFSSENRALKLQFSTHCKVPEHLWDN